MSVERQSLNQTKQYWYRRIRRGEPFSDEDILQALQTVLLEDSVYGPGMTSDRLAVLELVRARLNNTLEEYQRITHRRLCRP